MSINSNDLANIKLINVIEHKNKKVIITCDDRFEGSTVSESISNNSTYLGCNGAKFKKGITMKDFTYKFDTEEEAKYFFDKLTEVKNMSATPTSTNPMGTDPTGTVPAGANSTTLYIVLAAVVIIAIGVFVWMKSK